MDARTEGWSGPDTSGPAEAGKDSTAVRYHYLDGLRGWAALAVVVFHSTNELFGQAIPQLNGGWFVINDGWLALFLFFVLSGFVFSRPYLTARPLDKIMRAALGRYVRLTIPITAACLLALVLLATGAMYNHDAAPLINRVNWLGIFYTFEPSLWACLKFAFYDVYFNYNLSYSWNVFLWPMPYELAGSFLALGIVSVFGAGVRVRMLSCVGAILLFWRSDPIYLAFVYGYVLANVHDLLADKPVTRSATGNVLGLLIVAIVAIYRYDHDGSRTTAALGGFIVLAAILSPLLRRLLSSKLSQWLGRISFPLYLMHSLVLVTISSFLIVKLHDLSWATTSIACVVVPVTIAASLAVAHLFRPVELLAIECSHRFARFLMKADAEAGSR